MADQADFPDIYLDESVASGGVGSEADPYSDFSEINWTTGGDNSVYDYYNNTPTASVTINLKEGEEWRERLLTACDGTATYPIIIQSYGSGANPMINAADLMTTWVADEVEDGQTDEITNALVGVDYIHYMQFTTSASGGTLNTIKVYVGVDNGPVTAVKCAVYTDDNDTPKTLVTNSESAELAGLTANDWNEFSVAGAPSLSGSTNYWIACWCDGSNPQLIYYSIGGKNNRCLESKAYDSWPTTAGGGSVNDTGVGATVVMGSANVWKKTGVTTEPNVVVFDGTWGVYISGGVASLDANYEWYWDSDVLYVYADGGDPDTQWPSGIDVGQRTSGIYVNNDYIDVDGIDAKYSNESGIVIVTADNSTLSNCNVSHCSGASFNLYTADNCTLDNCLSTGGPGGISITGGSDSNIIQNCEVNGSVSTKYLVDGLGGLYISGDSDLNIIRYNYFHDFPEAYGDGMVITGSSEYNDIYYNVIHDTTDGIHTYGSGTEYNEIYNNVVYNTFYECYGLEDGADYNILKNNIGIRTSVGDIVVKGWNGAGKNNTLENNLFYSGGGDLIIWNATDETWGTMNWAEWVAHGKYDQNSISVDPQFIDTTNDNFRLLMGSPCRNAGTAVGLVSDYLGIKIRHAPDIGAYEEQTNALF